MLGFSIKSTYYLTPPFNRSISSSRSRPSCGVGFGRGLTGFFFGAAVATDLLFLLRALSGMLQFSCGGSCVCVVLRLPFIIRTSVLLRCCVNLAVTQV